MHCYMEKKKDMTNRLARFDFATGKAVVSGEQELNRDFAKRAKLEVVDGSKEGSFDYMDNAVVVGIVQA